MAMSTQHRILIATDGSRSAQGALATALKFPWPAASRFGGVVARENWPAANSAQVDAAIESTCEAAAAAVRSALARRWPEAKVMIIDAPAVDAILAEAERFNATLIVLGWRGHGTFRRLLTGSVSRSVASQAQCPVLVVREAASAVRRFVVGFDGGPNADRAVEFLGSLDPGKRGRVTLVNVVEPTLAPASLRFFPSSTRARLRREVAAVKEERYQQGQAIVAAAADQLKRSGWTAQSQVRLGDPLATLLKAVEEHGADVLVLGARATSGLERALLGSVANGAMDRSPIPVLLVR